MDFSLVFCKVSGNVLRWEFYHLWLQVRDYLLEISCPIAPILYRKECSHVEAQNAFTQMISNESSSKMDLFLPSAFSFRSWHKSPSFSSAAPHYPGGLMCYITLLAEVSLSKAHCPDQSCFFWFSFWLTDICRDVPVHLSPKTKKVENTWSSFYLFSLCSQKRFLLHWPFFTSSLFSFNFSFIYSDLIKVAHLVLHSFQQSS